jgi:hypothetical protein
MEATLTSGTALRSESRRFYVWMAALFLLIAFGGFTPTYWAKIAHSTFHAPPIVHIHGALLFTWTLFYFMQTALVASGRTPAHRAWGLVGISLFSVLVCSIIVTKITLLRLDELSGYGEASRRFAAVSFLSLPMLIGLFALAIANVRRPEIHKRWMFVLLAGMMTPAVARVFIYFLAPPGVLDGVGGPPPPFVSVPPAIVGPLLVIVAMLYDWRTRGRPHRVYVYGIVLLIAEPILVVLAAGTDTWLSTAAVLQRALG